MPKKNLVLFFVLLFLILVGWTYVESKLWPPKPPQPRTPDAWVWKEQAAPAQAEVVARLLAAPAAPLAGLDTAVRLVSDAAVLDSEAERERLAAVYRFQPRDVTPPDPNAVGAGTVAVAGTPATSPLAAAGSLLAGKVEMKAPQVPLAVKGTEQKDVTLGSATDFNLKVTLTTKGAGIRQLILNKFQKADAMGLPVWKDKKAGIKEPLDLIPDNPDRPSNRLYGYARPEEKHPEHPLTTLGELQWSLVEPKPDGARDDDQPVTRAVFTTGDFLKDFTITKTYTLNPQDYHVGLTVEVERRNGADAKPLPFRYQLAGAHRLPIEGEWYTYVYRNAYIGVVDAKGRVERDLQDSRSIAFEDGGNEIARQDNSLIRYAGVATQYFASVIAVDGRQEPGVESNFLAWARPTVESTNKEKPFLDDITVRVVTEPMMLKPGDRMVHRYVLYNGPIKVGLLSELHGVDERQVDRYLDVLHLNTLTDYHSPGAMGRFSSAIGWSPLLIKCTNLMHWLLWNLHKVIWNYGLCIIFLTILVRGMMFPLSRKQSIASVKMQAKMQELAPEVKKLEEKYKNDPMALQQAKHELYLRRGINPLSMMGSCWVVFLQMPIFLGLYYALQESIHFRLAPFLWIENLAAPDMLIYWTNKIPWISDPSNQGSFLYLGPYFNLLPIVAVALMIVQQKMLTPPAQDEQQAMQQKMMKYMMIFFGLMFYKVAAGLCMYFIASSLWGLTERKLLPKRSTATTAGTNPAPAAKQAATPGRSRRQPRGVATNGKDGGRGLLDGVREWVEKVLREAKKK